MIATPLRVFLSYSHDSPEHATRVLELADRLRHDGIDAWIDQYEPAPAAGWPRWMLDQIEQADRVLVLCTETYQRRFAGHETQGGRGVDWEGAILTGEIYRRRQGFVIPAVFHGDDLAFVPTPVRDDTYYVLDGEAGYGLLYRRLTEQHSTPAPPVGELRQLSPQPRRSLLGESVATTKQASPQLDDYRAWARDRFRHVTLLGLGQGDMRLDLDRIYVPLRVTMGGPSRDLAFLGDPGDDAGPRHRGHSLADREPFDISALFQHIDSRHTLVLGDVGAGKTTALWKLHKTCAREGGPALGLVDGVLPVFLRLRNLRPEDLDHELSDYLARELRGINTSFADDVAHRLLDHGRLLLLFDGLDEIADETHRGHALHYLAWQLRSLPQARAVVSCREAGWSSSLQRSELANSFLHVSMRPLEDDQIRDLVDSWHLEAANRLDYYSRTDAMKAAQSLNYTLLKDPEYGAQQIKVLVSTPLLLTLLCIVVMRGGDIPRRRVDFYEECLRVLLGSWRQKAGRAAPVELDTAAAALEAIAWQMHSKNKEDISALEASSTLKTALGLTPGQIRDTLSWLCQDAGLLSRFNERQLGFPHLGLQEHLTARGLATQPDLLVKIGTSYDLSWWREVFLLLASLPERAGFGPLSEFLIEQGALEHQRGLFSQCLQQCRRLDLGPLEQALTQGDAARQQGLLNLLASHTVPAVIDLVERFVQDEQAKTEEVAKQAQQLLDAQASGNHQGGLKRTFLAYGQEEAKRTLDRLRSTLDRLGCEVLNPHGWPPLDQCFVEAETADKVLVIAASTVPDEEAVQQLLILLDPIPAHLLLLPADPKPVLPPGLRQLPLLEVSSFDDLAAFEPIVRPAAEPAIAKGSIETPTTRSALDVEDFAFSLGPSTRPSRSFTENVSGEVFLPVPAGRYLMGGDIFERETPAHWVHCSDFWLARTPVTNRQYDLFLQATKHPRPPTWRERKYSAAEQPVVGASWHDATAYCDWLTAESNSGQRFQLPSEAQWEAAARGIEGNEYPWGSEPPDPQRACFDLKEGGQPAVVGSSPTGSGPFDHLDLAGNVWEWCLDLWEESYKGWRDDEPLDPIGRADDSFRPLRGGCWWDDASTLRSARRSRNDPDGRVDAFGFRVCCVPPSL